MTTEERALALQQALIQGDLSNLSPAQKSTYYLNVCQSLGLNPLTKPFGYLKLSGGLQLYANRNCTDQLRSIHKVSITSLERQRDGDLVTVIAYAKLPDGRTDSAIGAVPIKGLYGDALANAFMKCETKAKRRVTLSICGLGMTDESELETISGAEVVEGPVPAEPEYAEDYVPTREQDPEPVRKASDRLVAFEDDRLWVRWKEIEAKAKEVGLDPPKLKLPIGVAMLSATATELKELTEQVMQPAQT